MVEKKRITLGVAGGIAAYKSVYLLRLLKKAGHDIRVVPTKNSLEFVGPATWRTLSGREPAYSLWKTDNSTAVPHISLGQDTDLFIVAPATANILGKMNGGIADDLLSAALLAADAPILLVPAMNSAMLDNPAVQRNITALLERKNITFMEPESGVLACGYEGRGKMPEPEEIVTAAAKLLRQKPEQRLNWLVTGGSTREYIDPVRYITNGASGKTGAFIAAEAYNAGHDITFIRGPGRPSESAPYSVVPVQTAQEMFDAVNKRVGEADILIMTAAVADYTPVKLPKKMKKTSDTVRIALNRTPDILHETRAAMKPGAIRIGFAAETDDLIQNARGKMEKKALDIIVANQIGDTQTPFGGEHNTVTVISGDNTFTITNTHKKEIAKKIVNTALDCYNHGTV